MLVPNDIRSHECLHARVRERRLIKVHRNQSGSRQSLAIEQEKPIRMRKQRMKTSVKSSFSFEIRPKDTVEYHVLSVD